MKKRVTIEKWPNFKATSLHWISREKLHFPGSIVPYCCPCCCYCIRCQNQFFVWILQLQRSFGNVWVIISTHKKYLIYNLLFHNFEHFLNSFSFQFVSFCSYSSNLVYFRLFLSKSVHFCLILSTLVEFCLFLSKFVLCVFIFFCRWQGPDRNVSKGQGYNRRYYSAKAAEELKPSKAAFSL